ncbi:MAG: hypothetical protein GKR88_07135 [Flavobacteriaceae bacterium]|nr:MAG: hypothetical protein GKR88_07135 [Flavobacteriaceae bacterium]
MFILKNKIGYKFKFEENQNWIPNEYSGEFHLEAIPPSIIVGSVFLNPRYNREPLVDRSFTDGWTYTFVTLQNGLPHINVSNKNGRPETGINYVKA